ncbi:cellulose binding domain-containing protein [Motilibacter peucedani]|uniref:cellulose binding domain-containing protein n=1 Tax=Motilibacter peucedani TaxID=598650 RepID=UPI0016007C55|nr:cellulose binding domain-containing protein [Motilibacter peucedani]
MKTGPAVLAVATLTASIATPVGTPASASSRPAPTTTVESCKAVYSLNGTWTGRATGFTSTLRVYNTTTASVTDWTLVFTFSGAGQRVTRLWDGTFSQLGHRVTVHPTAANRTIAAGKQLTIGFVASGVDGSPRSVTLSGTACTETASRGHVVPGAAAALHNALASQVAAGHASGGTLLALRHRVSQMQRDESRDNVKAEISHLNGFIREFHWPAAKVDVTPEGTTALLAVAQATLTNLR